MTQEEKQLLGKVLCTMLPYNIKGRVYAETTNGEYDINGDLIFFNSPFDVVLDGINTSTEEIHVTVIGNEDTVDFIEDQQVDGVPYTIEEFKPYLRPMSSMTLEEKKEFEDICTSTAKDRAHFVMEGSIDSNYMLKKFDWLNSNHFDYRGLIFMGLALEASKDMYKID